MGKCLEGSHAQPPLEVLKGPHYKSWLSQSVASEHINRKFSACIGLRLESAHEEPTS